MYGLCSSQHAAIVLVTNSTGSLFIAGYRVLARPACLLLYLPAKGVDRLVLAAEVDRSSRL